MEVIKLYLQSIKYIFTRCKWDKLSFDEESKLVEDDYTIKSNFDFNASTAILFSSDYMKPVLKLDKYNLRTYRFKVQQECVWLINQGYTEYIVNYGCNYGIIALSELLYMKNKYNLNINLHYGKVMHEHARCVTRLDSIRIVQICHCHRVGYIKALPPCDFVEKVICRVSRISSEHGIMKTDQKIPKSIYDHYKKLEQQLHECLFKLT